MSNILDEIFSQQDEAAEQSQEVLNSDIERCRYSLVEFVKTYLSDTGGESLDELCSFHYDIAERLQQMVLTDKKKKTNTCFLSPRGHGKSFWTSYAFPLWCIAYKHTKNILIVTNEGSLGRQFIIDLMQFIEDNEKFLSDFGELMGDKIWTRDKIACKNGVCVSTKGSEAATRGVKIFGVRPTVIICDDILSESNSSNDDQRQKLYEWYNKVLLPSGGKYCSVFVIGTVLNDACLLYKMMTDAQFSDYHTKKYQAVISYSDSPLWDEWLKIRNELSNPDRIKDSDAFYHSNKEEMLKGTEVLWDRYEDTYYELMKEKLKIGDDAWATEYMNDGLLEESRAFKEEWLKNNMYDIKDLPDITDVWIGIDAAIKAKKTSDNSAIVVVGKGSDGYLYVLEEFARKIPVDELIETILLYCIQYLDLLRSVRTEDVVFQILLKELIERKAKERNLYLPFEPIKPPKDRDKFMKLGSLILPIKNGYFKFRKGDTKLLNELRRFPKGATDDVMDAFWLATCNIIAGNGSTTSLSFDSIERKRSKGRWGRRWNGGFF